MPRPARRSAAPSPTPAPQPYVALEGRLVLLAWLNSLLGYAHNRELLAKLREVGEGFDTNDGRSLVYHYLISRQAQVKLRQDDLARYDSHIRDHLAAMNAGRPEPITLRYFQYLAALYTEIFLDRYFNGRAGLLRDLNAFVADRNAARLPGDALETDFGPADLKKLAFWMATGSGKTLILHLNYRQFLHYNDQPLDNILLLTPNEGLSEQHLAELASSGIPARRFDLNESGLGLGAADTVRVIEITKLVEDKRGGGVSVPVEAFEGNNLILVDEGHKGTGGETWRRFRDALGQTGFTFEYSATFGQALTAARNDQLTAEYGKAIAFDYSYRYFYGDGFGKDFRILNLKEETSEADTDLLLLGNLLAFYEQKRVFAAQAEALRPYNLQRPLWVFVGSTVNAVYSQDKRKRSDVLTVVRFLHRVLENEGGWAVAALDKLLTGQSGLRTPYGEDLFETRFTSLKASGLTPQAVYQDILARVFQAPAGGGLHLCDMRGQPDELGLRAAGADAYFGLVYIGDTAAFKKLVEEEAPEITLEEDALAGSLFASLDRPDTSLDILIGARKFMEGWNSWRVATMGLLNIGRQEGAQIIQLFGRGVRLAGRDFSLKRSAALPGPHPPPLPLLETLNIFAVRANYMGQFRDYLEREGVETDEKIEMRLAVRLHKAFLNQGLVTPRLPADCDFKSAEALWLAHNSAVRVRVDLSLRVAEVRGEIHDHEGRVAIETGQAGQEGRIPSRLLDLVDWPAVYLDLLAYKERQGLSNLLIPPGAPRAILEQGAYTLVADSAIFNPQTYPDVEAMREVVRSVLRSYVDRFYRWRRQTWEGGRLVYQPLDERDPNLSFNRLPLQETGAAYVVRLDRSQTDLREAIQKLVDDAEALYQADSGDLPRLYFDRHLYLPLLLEGKAGLTLTPPGLKDSERDFVRALRAYWEAEKGRALAGRKVFLLRNLSRGQGVSFFDGGHFYPDFILWVTHGEWQHIIFVEPHGMLHANAYRNDPKALLHERLPELAQGIATRSGLNHVTLDSYILSATGYEQLRLSYGDGDWDRETFAAHHILFLEQGRDTIERLFQSARRESSSP